MQPFIDRLAGDPMRAKNRICSYGFEFLSMVHAMGAALVWILLSLTVVATASAEESERSREAEPAAAAQQLVQSTIVRVLAAMSADRNKVHDQPSAAMAIVEEIVMPSVDLERVSHLVLGKHWRLASVPQRERFKREFGAHLLRTYAVGVVDYMVLSDKLGTGIKFLPAKVNGDRSLATVRTEVGRSILQVQIDYRLHRRDESWKVYDVLVEGVSTVRMYRSSFIAETSKHGIDHLTDRIAAKNRKFRPA
jgi:phospholipid transport system substrate-binding protein